MDRQKRKCNLIVRNVPELPKQVKSEQIEGDTAKLSDLFHKEFGIIRAQIKKIIRLEKRTFSERQANRILCDELKKRRDQGKTNLTIRNGKIIQR